jgi:DnaJ domain
VDEHQPYRPKFGFDIRIKPPEEPRPKKRARPCEWPGCGLEGAHPAPKNREHLRDRSWYCLDHVREYNSNWDFFAGLPDDAVRTYQEADLTGHRPTWRFGSVGSSSGMDINEGKAGFAFRTFADPFGLFGRDRRRQSREARQLSARQAKAFDVFNLDQAAGRDAIRRRYTELVKRFHPDANGGDRGREERLREVIDAYHVLKGAGFC